MSPRAPLFPVASNPAPRLGQKSFTLAPVPEWARGAGVPRGVLRGQAARGFAGPYGRAQAVDFWVGLITRRCGSREACADLFAVTFQTACNWFDGVSTPSFLHVLRAVALWPGDFGLTADGIGGDA